MKKAAVVVLAAVLVAVAAAQDFGGGAGRRPGAGDYIGEAGGALLGGALVGAGATAVLGLAGAALLYDESDMEGWGPLAGAIIGGAAGAALGYPLGCGLGTTLIGKSVHAEGNTGAAYGGAYAGLALGALAGLVSRRWDVGLLAAGVLPPAGAVIGYNSSGGRYLGARLAPPTLAYRTRLGPDRQRYSAFDCRLVTVSF